MRKVKQVLCGCQPQLTEEEIMNFCGEKNCRFGGYVSIRNNGTAHFKHYDPETQSIIKYNDGTLAICERHE